MKGCSDAQLLKYYDDIIVDHPALRAAREQLERRSYPLLDGRLILFVGGSGVGKTATLRTLVRSICKNKNNHLEEKQETLPAFYLELEPPDSGTYKFKDLYRDSLLEMQAPLVDHTVAKIDRSAENKIIKTLHVESRKRPDEKAFKKRYIDSLKNLQVLLVAYDEALSIFSTGNPRSEKDRLARISAQARKLKTFVNKTPTSIVLAGAYDFYEMAMCEGQVARRTRVVHMEPYEADDKGLSGFSEALIGLIEYLPVQHSLDISDISTELFLQSLGCIGILKNILIEGLKISLDSNERLQIKHLRAAYLSAAQLSVIREEMDKGREEINELINPLSLAVKAERSTTKSKSKLRRQKPGEMSPTHRKKSAEKW